MFLDAPMRVQTTTTRPQRWTTAPAPTRPLTSRDAPTPRRTTTTRCNGGRRSCTYPPVDVPGCTDTNATNFDERDERRRSCTYPPVDVPGCMDANATNHNANATTDDGSCTYPPADVPGCMDANATNFDANATVDDASCAFSDPAQHPMETKPVVRTTSRQPIPLNRANRTTAPWRTFSARWAPWAVPCCSAWC